VDFYRVVVLCASKLGNGVILSVGMRRIYSYCRPLIGGWFVKCCHCKCPWVAFYP